MAKVIKKLNNLLHCNWRSSVLLPPSYEIPNDAHVSSWHKCFSSNSVTALCQLPGASMTAWCYVNWLITVTINLVWAGRYKAKTRSITFLMTYWHARIFILLFVALCLAAETEPYGTATMLRCTLSAVVKSLSKKCLPHKYLLCIVLTESIAQVIPAFPAHTRAL
jgi:hypothetical protein